MLTSPKLDPLIPSLPPGVPLLYLAAITLPIGFVLNPTPDYGYPEACWLNPVTGFVWSFIAPVVVIILVRSTRLCVGDDQADSLSVRLSVCLSVCLSVRLSQVNIGFFVMSLVIMCKHHRRQTHKSRVAVVK